MASSTDSHSTPSIPAVAEWFQDGFHRFLRRYLRRHFDAVAVTRDARPDLGPDSPHAAVPEQPVVIYGNHPSWWDPLIAHFLNRKLLDGRQFYAPIDAQALKQYQVFTKLGFFGVERQSGQGPSGQGQSEQGKSEQGQKEWSPNERLRNLNETEQQGVDADLRTPSGSRLGASTFLKTSQMILAKDDAALWITPEGRFADARDHDQTLMPGLAHLCHLHRGRPGQAIAMALEYVFWDERLPVCLARFGRPLSFASHPDWNKTQWAEVLTETMRENQQALAKVAIARDSEPLDNLLAGSSGAGGIYDGFRRIKSYFTGQPFQPRHGSQF